jgi:uncharacterized membrane protein
MDNFNRFRKISVLLFRISSLFLILFTFHYYLIIPLQGLIGGYIEPWSIFFDILVGIAIISTLIYAFFTSHAPIGLILNLLTLAYWIFLPSNFIINEKERLSYGLLGTYYSTWAILLVIGIITVLALINIAIYFVYRIMKMEKFRKSEKFKNSAIIKEFDLGSAKIQASKKKIIALTGLFFCLIIPGLIPFASNAFHPSITIDIKSDYDIKFNFWVHPNTSILTQNERDELNEHKCVLDIMFRNITENNITLLKEWDNALPNCTYRAVLDPGDDPYNIFDVTTRSAELLVKCFRNGTLRQDRFLGFCYDIERQFAHQKHDEWNNTDGLSGLITHWDKIFAWIDEFEQNNTDINLEIEMESVTEYWFCTDDVFDNDMDLNKEYQYLAIQQNTFDYYAPMIYRAWPADDWNPSMPFGREKKSNEHWETSYFVYSRMYALVNTVGVEKSGCYLGITNMSQYGRDLTQYDDLSWTDEKSGFNNLIQDTLICKHFGIREVTYFLLWTHPEDHSRWNETQVNGGVFDTYGIDFLDVMNDTVNGEKRPGEIILYYDALDYGGASVLRKDWLHNINHWYGIVEMVFLAIIAIITPIILDRMKRNKNKTEDVVKKEEK